MLTKVQGVEAEIFKEGAFPGLTEWNQDWFCTGKFSARAGSLNGLLQGEFFSRTVESYKRFPHVDMDQSRVLIKFSSFSFF